MKKFTCFVVCAIGEEGTDIRKNADDLLKLVIEQALEFSDFEVVRGDQRHGSNKISSDVIQDIQEAELCIVDISLPNPNVYYELGRRDETGKDCLLLKSKKTEDVPIDVADRRCILYDLHDVYSVYDAVRAIREYANSMKTRNFEARIGGSSLSDIALALSRVENKVDRLNESNSRNSTHGAPEKENRINESNCHNSTHGSPERENRINESNCHNSTHGSPEREDVPEKDWLSGDPRDVFMLALQEGNLLVLEEALDRLRLRVTKMKFLDVYAEVAAAKMGSDKAGNILIENAEEFIESDVSFRKKIEYLGSLVTYLNSADKELENLDLVEKMCDTLWAMKNGAETNDVAQIFNQRNRLYHGIYDLLKDEEWIEKAIEQLEEAKKYAPPNESYVYYNLAICFHEADRLEEAKKNILEAIERNGENKDPDHFAQACQILKKLNDPQYPEKLKELKQLDPVKARLLEFE